MKWRHARKGLIEGEIIRERGPFVHILVANKVRLGQGPAGWRFGFRGVYAAPGTIIEVRKSLLQVLEEASDASGANGV